MEFIDKSTWPRAAHFDNFNQMDVPQYNVCAEVNIANLKQFAKNNDLSIFALVVYVISRAANQVEAIRMRARGDEVVKHKVVHPSFTVPTENELFAYCTIDYTNDLSVFLERVEQGIEASKANPSLEDEPGRDDYLFMSCLPWIRFTSISHAIYLNPMGSVPRLSWGKYEKEGDKVMMPLSIQVHHGLVDGSHLGQFYEQVQTIMDTLDRY